MTRSRRDGPGGGNPPAAADDYRNMRAVFGDRARGVGRRAVRVAALAAAVALAVTGCGGDGNGDAGPDSAPTTPPATTTPPTTPTTPTPSPTGPDVQLIRISIRDGKVDPPPDVVQVERGATVRLEVTSDRADELHLHGYDLSAELEPGVPSVIEFVADRTGRFELETHGSHLVLVFLDVR